MNKPLTALCLGLLAAGLWRARPDRAPVAGRVATAAAHAAGAAQRVYVDPATGNLREPTAAELAAEAQVATLRVSQKLALAGATAIEETRLPDGTVGVRLPERYQHSVVICRQPDGTFGEHCAGSAP